MAHRRIVFFPLPELGHIYPTLELARHYVAETCEVVYLTARQFEGEINSVGARVEPVFEPDAQVGLTGQKLWHHQNPESGPGSRRRKVEEVLRSFARDHACDLFLLDRHLATSYHCDIQESVGKTPRLFFGTSLLRWDAPNHDLLDRPSLFFCPSSFEVSKFRERGAMIHYVEPSIYRHGRNTEVPFDDFTHDPRPLVIAAWGTQSARYSHLAKVQSLLITVAQRHPELRFHMAFTPPMGKASGNDTIPSNMRVSVTLPQLTLLRSATLLITHGGLNSLKEAFIEQVPVLVFPFLFEQPYNALRVERNDLGVALFPEEQIIRKIENAILQSLSGTFNSALAEMRQQFLAWENATPSHVLIDSYLR